MTIKHYIALAAAAAFSSGAFAQMNPLPPSSATDGVLVQPIGLNSGSDHWDNTSSIGAYKPVSTTDGTAPINTPTYNPLGITFSASLPAIIQSRLETLNTNGGILRTIFLAESAGWHNSFGYTYDGNPASATQSFTVFESMESNTTEATQNVTFGDFFDVSLAAGDLDDFDLWFQGAGTEGSDIPDPATSPGGVYTLFRPENSTPFLAPGNILWAQESVVANTWIAPLGVYADVETYLVALEDWRLDRGSDVDYTDSIFAFQFYTVEGTPFTPVPEPSTYGLIGAGALIGLIWLRRFKRKASISGVQLLPV